MVGVIGGEAWFVGWGGGGLWVLWCYGVVFLLTA